VSLCPVPLAVSAALPKPLPWPVRVSVPITRMFIGSYSAGLVGVALVGRCVPSSAVTSTVVMLPDRRVSVSQPAALTVVASTVITLATATARRSTECRGRSLSVTGFDGLIRSILRARQADSRHAARPPGRRTGVSGVTRVKSWCVHPDG